MKKRLAFLSVAIAFGCVQGQIGGPGQGSGMAGAAGMGGSDDNSGSGGGGMGGLGGSGAAAGETPGTGGSIPDSTACSSLAVDRCASNSMCAVLSGQRITSNPACVLPAEMVICGTNQGCMTANVRATDLKSMDWLFPSTCIPAGWTDASSKGTRLDACPSAAGGNPNPDAGTR